ncbi:MAG: glycosyltransferase family 4 protein [Gammaproteobacteria bacterium]|nr:glycosyltransferase family 4 protein [Gammaproteobacteria bacterium]
MRFTLFTSSLQAGGAERSVSVLAEALASRGHAVTVVTWNSNAPDFYSLSEAVKRERVSFSRQSLSVKWYNIPGNLRRLRLIRKVITATAPDTAISFLDGSNELLLMATAGLPFTKLVSCQNNIFIRSHHNRRWEHLRRRAYRLADRVVFLDHGLAERVQRFEPRWRCAAIPNPLVPVDTVADEAAAGVIKEIEPFRFCIAAMGRLVHQKGFDLLLEAFRLVSEKVPDTGLVILGEGPLRGDLQTKCRELGLEDRVSLPGVVRKPHAVIAHTTLFAFSSRFEGQGMALAEAMACGVPVIAFDCPVGPRHMVEATDGGLIVPAEDVDALAASIIRLLTDAELRSEYARKALRITDELSPSKIAGEWEVLATRCQ